MLVCKVENLFGENDYCSGLMAKHTTLAVSFKDLFVDDSYDKAWDERAVEKDGVKYLTLDTLRETSLLIMPCDLQEVEV